jgi:preprotein translocase subunit SecG
MLLYYAIATLHVIVCIILVLVVLLQSGKGADLAGAFGGGATQTAFGSRGPASFLSKMTAGSAIIFMLTSISLAMITTRTETKSILETTGKQSAVPAKKASSSTAAPVATPTPEQISKQIEELQKKNQAAPAPVQQPAPAPDPSKQPAKK